MTQIVRHCPDCGREQAFEQYHGLPGSCPDSPDGQCPEWSCAACGAALLIDVAWALAAMPVPVAQVRGRVA